MDIIVLNKLPVAGILEEKQFNIVEELLQELRKRILPDEIVEKINQDIQSINDYTGLDKDLRKKIKRVTGSIIELLEKELKLVPKNFYRNRWLALGLAVFGIPFGLAMGASLGNMAFIGIGLPIGMAVGIAIGTDLDKKAKAKGNQLNIEIIN